MKSTVVDITASSQRDHGGIAFRELAVASSQAAMLLRPAEQLGAHGCAGPTVHTLSKRATNASASHNPLRRQNPRQEPYAVILHVRICAGVTGDCHSYRDQINRESQVSPSNAYQYNLYRRTGIVSRFGFYKRTDNMLRHPKDQGNNPAALKNSVRREKQTGS